MYQLVSKTFIFIVCGHKSKVQLQTKKYMTNTKEVYIKVQGSEVNISLDIQTSGGMV